MKIRTYTELSRIPDFAGRYDYLALQGNVGEATFGFDRWMNQQFYTSAQWRRIRHAIIVRDLGCDLGVEDREIHDKIYIHHMNPITAEDLREGDENLLDPEFLIATTHMTHNAIHYGDVRLLPQPFVERSPCDTKLW